MDADDIGDDEDTEFWHHCGFITCHDGVRRAIFVHCNTRPGSASNGARFGLLLLPTDEAPDPPGTSVAGDLFRGARPLIAALRRAGSFTLEEQTVFANHVMSMSTIDSDAPYSASAADALFDQILSEELGGWQPIGSRSGSSVCGGFRTRLHARPFKDGSSWCVLERGTDGNAECTITDDGSGRSIFEQFMRRYYIDELEGG